MTKRLLSLLNLSNYIKLDVAITNVCNSRCKTCSIWKIYKEKPDLIKEELSLRDWSLFFKNNPQINQITFSGGEPFLKKDLLKIVFSALDEIKNLSYINIVTNALIKDLVINQVTKILSHPRLTKLHIAISIDGGEKLHDKIRGITGNYRAVRETFTSLKKINNKKLSLDYSYTISKYNQGKMDEFFNETKINPQNVVLCFAQQSPRYHHNNGINDFVLDKDIIKKEVLSFLKRYHVNNPESLIQWLFLKSFLNDLRIPCVAGQNTFHLDPYGNITKCSLSNQVLGNINDGLKKRIPPKDCYCYTACESYFGILTLKPLSLIKLILNVN